MNKADIIKLLASEEDISDQKASSILNSLVDIIQKNVKKESVKISGLGVFKVVKTKARRGVVPGTKKRINIPAGKKVKFTASSELKSKIK